MQNDKNFRFYLIICAIFSIAMAYLESAVVVYLRELYYPEGFKFPLKEIPTFIYITEIGREIATIVMLWAIAKLVAHNAREWFAYFAYNFGVWDIWYYIWLKLLLNWPATFLEWDILFLIPVPWGGPVLAPVLVSAALITAAYIILYLEHRNTPLKFSKLDWLLEILAGLIVIISFLTQSDILIAQQFPQHYPWWLFAVGFILGLLIFIRRVIEAKKQEVP